MTKHSQQIGQFFCQQHQAVGGSIQASEIVFRRKNRRESFVEHDEGEEDDGGREPVDDVLNHLNGNRIRRKSSKVNRGHVEAGNVDKS